ncbi:MAG TPA: flagellar protein FlaG [Gammaproteobacteria bacterium]|jgi:flagellar protein FlaG|nr:flagellar protein FlaG [Candidatus Ruthturnera sp.]HIJ33650.1 flagellar protein FlaG [Gammaproteobacteria bacterium]
MDINNDVAAVQQPAPKIDVDIKEQFDKMKSSSSVAEVRQPSLKDVVSDRSKKSSEAVDIIKEVGDINAHISVMQSSLQLSVDSASGRNVVTVMDKSSGEVIRQIPNKEVLQMSARIKQYMASMQYRMQQGRGELDMKGLLFDGKG